MNILIINYEFPPIGAGAANASWFLAKALVAQGNDVTVMTSAYQELKGYSTEAGIHVYRIPAFRKRAERSNIWEMASFLLTGLWHIGRIVKERKIDVCISFFTIPCGPISYYIRRRFDIPYVISLRGGDVPGLEPSLERIHRLLRPGRREILSHAEFVVANSQGLAEASKKVDPFPVEIIYNGVDTVFYYPASGSRDHVKDKFRFLFVGRFQEQKNLFYLLDQFVIVSTQASRKMELCIVGDGPQKKDLQEYAKAHGIQDKIAWYGWIDKAALRQAYQQADCLINPSLYEGMPNVVLEGMACGLPVIASNVPGNDAVVRHGETGFLFSLSQPEELQKAMLRLLNNSEDCKVFGLNARAWVERSFSWSEAGSRYIALLTKKL